VVKFLPSEEIESSAQSFLKKYHPERTLPVPIEEILDLKLKINIIPLPGLFDTQSIDSFLSLDCKDLYIDHDQIEHRYNRARFSLAHETGHLVLHRDYIRSLEIDSLEKWKEIILGRGQGHAAMETQANMFASYLLMPSVLLEKEFEQCKSELSRGNVFEGLNKPSDEVLAPFAARRIARTFHVSERAAENRLLNWLASRKG